MRNDLSISATVLSHAAEQADASAAREKTGAQTRRVILAAAAMLPALSLRAVAAESPDARVIHLAHQLIAGIKAEYPLRVALKAAWAASERVRYQLLADNPNLQYGGACLHDMLQRTTPGQTRAIAYEKWHEVCRECRAISDRILQEMVHTGPGLAAHVLAYYYLERDEFRQSNGGPLLRAAVAMLGEELPAHMNFCIQQDLESIT